MDADAAAWGRRALAAQDGVRFCDVLDDLLIFINAFLMMNTENRIAVVAGAPWGSKVLYPSPEQAVDATAAAVQGGSARPSLSAIAEQVGQGVRRIASAGSAGGAVKKEEVAAGPTQLADALSRALCVLNRFAPALRADVGINSGSAQPSQSGADALGSGAQRHVLQPRMLVVGCTPDDGSQYRAVINATFVAQ